MGTRKSASEGSNLSGFPGVLHKFCKEEDVLIIPQFVTQLVGKQAERVSPKKSKDSKLEERHGSCAAFTNESKVDDLLICGSLQPPQVGIVYGNPDDKETPVGLVLKGIYVEFALVNAIGKSLKPYPNISSLKIENCCVSKEIVEALALLLADEPGRTVFDLSLDGNEQIAEALPLLLRSPTGVKYLSLQRCSLDDDAVGDLAEHLAFDDKKDPSLQVLNLSMNKIQNAGVSYLAEALRTNRTLLSLSLAGNQIDDDGVKHLVHVLQKFPLQYEEIVLRRRRIFEMIFRKKAAVDRCIEEWKTKGEVESQTPKMGSKSGERTGRKIRGLDGKIRCVSSRDRKGKLSSAKVNSGEKFRGKNGSGAAEGHGGAEPTTAEISALVQQVESEILPDKHPFVNEAKGGAGEGKRGKDEGGNGGDEDPRRRSLCKRGRTPVDGTNLLIKTVTTSEDGVWCAGCWSLGNLNLAYNYLTEESLQMFTELLAAQAESFGPKTGLLRLVLVPGNLYQENLPELQKLQSAIMCRNYKKEATGSGDLAPTGSILSGRKQSSVGKWNKNR